MVKNRVELHIENAIGEGFDHGNTQSGPNIITIGSTARIGRAVL